MPLVWAVHACPHAVLEPSQHTSILHHSPSRQGRRVGTTVPYLLHVLYVPQAWELLEEYTAKDFQGLAHDMRGTKPQRDKLRDALRTVLSQRNLERGWEPEQPQVLLGILCSDVRLGIRALRDWSSATGIQFVVPTSQVTPAYGMKADKLLESRLSVGDAFLQVSGVPVPRICGPVYIKFNSNTQVCS